MYMGRRRKYISEEEVKEANSKKAKRYYMDNVVEVRRKNLEKYYERKRGLEGGEGLEGGGV